MIGSGLVFGFLVFGSCLVGHCALVLGHFFLMQPPRLSDVLPTSLPQVTVLDVGAGAEGDDRYASLVEMGLAQVVGFEGDARRSQEADLQRGGAYRGLPYFLGTGKPATFHTTRYAGCSSLYEPDPAIIDLFTGMGSFAGGNFEVLDRRAVETVRLDDVAECPPPDLLKVDVQGAELDVLSNGTRMLSHALVVEIETEFLPLYRGQPLFGDVQLFMREQGFMLHKLIDLCGRCFQPVVMNNNGSVPMSQLLWADAVFVRDFDKLFAADNQSLLKASLILHEAYRSCDLVRRLMTTLDARQGTNWTARYGEAMRGGVTPLYLNPKYDPQLVWTRP